MNESEARDRAWTVLQCQEAHRPSESLVDAIQEALLKAQKDAIDHCILQAMMMRWATREVCFNGDETEEARNAIRFVLTDLIGDMNNMSSVRIASGGKVFTPETEGADADFGGSTEDAIIAAMDKDAVWF